MSALGGSRKVFDDCRRVTGQVRQILLAEDKDDDDDAVEGMAAIVGRMSDVLSAATKALARKHIHPPMTVSMASKTMFSR